MGQCSCKEAEFRESTAYDLTVDFDTWSARKVDLEIEPNKIEVHDMRDKDTLEDLARKIKFEVGRNKWRDTWRFDTNLGDYNEEHDAEGHDNASSDCTRHLHLSPCSAHAHALILDLLCSGRV